MVALGTRQVAFEIGRRQFITALGGAAAFGQSTFAQAAEQTYRLGFVLGRARDEDIVAAFFDELRLFGVAEGQNLTVLPDGFGLRNEQFPEIAAATVSAAPDVIVTAGDFAARIVQNATHKIPIVAIVDDMISAGLVSSLARPRGNITGVSLLATELDGKRQGILIEAVPAARQLATLSDATLKPRDFQALQDGAHLRGIELANYSVSSPEGIAPAIDAAKASGAAALNVLATPLFSVNRRVVIDRANVTRLPAIYQWPDMAEEGGLIGYGPRLTTIYRQIARQVVKVLRGVKPADLPIEQPTTFEFVVNLKTAKAIGHEVPAGLVARADKVIE
jgi:putative tryptophan/tyrosine transport system substrate-binding protein